MLAVDFFLSLEKSSLIGAVDCYFVPMLLGKLKKLLVCCVWVIWHNFS